MTRLALDPHLPLALIMALTALQFWFQRKWVHYDA